ncbi:hypothetical protein C8039_15615 [Halogeometricum sp. wsp3]|nr:hypothetical protein C8039_15615 [Halogeometricum sp. wsp3]
MSINAILLWRCSLSFARQRAGRELNRRKTCSLRCARLAGFNPSTGFPLSFGRRNGCFGIGSDQRKTSSSTLVRCAFFQDSAPCCRFTHRLAVLVGSLHGPAGS